MLSYCLPFHVTALEWWDLTERNRKKENKGSPRSASTLDAGGKCALRIRRQNQPARMIVSNDACNARFDRPAKPAQTAIIALAKINTNSMNRKNANATGCGNRSARFFVQPSFICVKLRYIRVRTASPP